ncbi:hypothetical protein BC833DRAFT_641189 [Globomyces pollinis-pini]|nr:hypothetical protein BC833DRAFT_641189 [Globomyces pollinis-pini]
MVDRVLNTRNSFIIVSNISSVNEYCSTFSSFFVQSYMNTPNTAGRKKPWKSTIGNLLKLIKAVSRYFPFTAGHGKTTLAWKMVIDDVNATNSANESGILDPKTAIERLLLEYESQVKNIQMATEGPSGTVTMDLTIQGAIAPLYERWDSYRNERKERELQLRESKFNLQQEEAIERKQMHQDSLEMLRLDLQTRSKEAENTAQFIKAFMLHIQKQ